MKRLDKFSILIETEEMGREVKRIADKHGINDLMEYTFIQGIGAYYNFYSGQVRDWSNKPDHEVITFDQFKEMFEGEIIGYECPYDILDWSKGDVFIPWSKTVNGVKQYHVIEKQRILPAPLVETWKPIYKQTSKTVMVGGKEWKVTKDGVTCIDKGFDPNDIEKLNLNLIVHIFGPTATLSEIKRLVDTYKELNK